jgi:hypothetical protein
MAGSSTWLFPVLPEDVVKVEATVLLWSLLVGLVPGVFWGPMAKLVINQEIMAPWMAKRRGVFTLIVNISVIGSFQVRLQDIIEGMPSYPSHLAKEN